MIDNSLWHFGFVIYNATVTPSHRRWIVRLAVLDLLVVLLCGLLVGLRTDELHQALADWTGEEDTSHQLRALGYLGLSLFQPPRQTADFAPLAYTDLPPFGANTFFEQEVEETKIRRSMQLLHDAGFRFIRQEFPWEDIEQPGRGQFWDTKFNHSTWDKYDRIVALAQEYGLEIVARLDHPPDWTRAEGHARGSFAPPDNYEDYGNFVAAVVARYRGRIKYYQLWNEPNIYPEWGEQPVNAADYVRLLKLGYTRAKAADPEAVIISAGLAQTVEKGPRNVSDLIFLQQMYDAGVRGYFDILAVQDYGLFTGPGDRRVEPERTNFSRPILIRELMVKNGDANKPIWAMEVGWNAQPPAFKDAPFGRVTETQQARYAVQAYARAQNEWPWMGPMMYWFFKRADDHEKDQPFYYFRMFDPDFTEHPVYGALKEYAAQARYLGLGFHQESDWALDYTGDWTAHASEAAAAGGYRVGQTGDLLRFEFNGTDVALALLRNPYSGLVRVSVDGSAPKELDLRATDPGRSGRLALAQGLDDGRHRVELAVVQGPVYLDGIVVSRTPTWLLWRSVLLTAAILIPIVLVVRARILRWRYAEARRRMRARLRL